MNPKEDISRQLRLKRLPETKEAVAKEVQLILSSPVALVLLQANPRFEPVHVYGVRAMPTDLFARFPDESVFKEFYACYQDLRARITLLQQIALTSAHQWLDLITQETNLHFDLFSQGMHYYLLSTAKVYGLELPSHLDKIVNKLNPYFTSTQYDFTKTHPASIFQNLEYAVTPGHLLNELTAETDTLTSHLHPLFMYHGQEFPQGNDFWTLVSMQPEDFSANRRLPLNRRYRECTGVGLSRTFAKNFIRIFVPHQGPDIVTKK